MDITGENGNHSRASSEFDAGNSETYLKTLNVLVKKDRSFSQVDTRSNKGCVPLYFERASSGWWYPRFDSPILEKEYQEFSFVNTRHAVVKILIYLLIAALIWMIYFGATKDDDNRPVLIAIACQVFVLSQNTVHCLAVRRANHSHHRSTVLFAKSRRTFWQRSLRDVCFDDSHYLYDASFDSPLRVHDNFGLIFCHSRAFI